MRESIIYTGVEGRKLMRKAFLEQLIRVIFTHSYINKKDHDIYIKSIEYNLELTEEIISEIIKKNERNNKNKR